MTNTDIWYAHHGDYKGSDPPYHDLNGIDWYDKLKKDLPAIRQATLEFLKIDGVDPKQHMDKNMVGEGWWGGVSFMFWGLKNKKMIQKGGSLFSYFAHIPGMAQLSVSILKPHTHIKPHSGDTDAIYRIHIPVYIPAGLPDCGFTIAGITRPWTDDDMIVFCDAYFHEAWNRTSVPRIIIILDVFKKELLSQQKKINQVVLASMKYKMIIGKLAFLKVIAEHTPAWMKNILRKVI